MSRFILFWNYHIWLLIDRSRTSDAVSRAAFTSVHLALRSFIVYSQNQSSVTSPVILTVIHSVTLALSDAQSDISPQ